MIKVSVIGVGNLGSCIAYEIAKRDIVDEMVLVDINKERAEGESEDIKQAIAFTGKTKISYGDYKDISDSDLVVVVAGKPRTPNIKSRLELGKINASIVASVAKEIKKNAPESIVVTVTNPMDIMNYIIWKETGFGRERIIGLGGQLDSARFTSVLGKKGNVIGEHGDSQVLVWSKVEGKYSEVDKKKINAELKEKARTVITKKGATIYAPANTFADVVQSIVKDEKKTFMCSYILEGEYGGRDVSIGVPVKLGFTGVEEVVNWELSDNEQKLFDKSVETVKRNIKEVMG